MKIGMIVVIKNMIGIVTDYRKGSRMCWTIYFKEKGYIHCGNDIEYVEVLK